MYLNQPKQTERQGAKNTAEHHTFATRSRTQLLSPHAAEHSKTWTIQKLSLTVEGVT
jgi:hypothetical protein